MKQLLILFTILSFTLSACAQSNVKKTTPAVIKKEIKGKNINKEVLDSVPQNRALVNQIIEEGKALIGKPYLYRADNSRAMDCSGFICHIFSKTDILFSGSSQNIASQVTKLRPNEIKVGDLLFFKGRNVNSTEVGHVAIVTKIEKDGTMEMMHSCSSGIVTEKYPNEYYRKRYLFAGRVNELYM